MSGNDSRGEETGMGKSKTHFRAKVLSQTTVLEGRTFRAFKCPPPPLLRVGQLHPEWHRLVSDQGKIPPPPKRLVSLGEVRRTPIFGFRRFSPFLSDLDWWVAGVLVSQAGERLQGDVSLESNVFFFFFLML